MKRVPYLLLTFFLLSVSAHAQAPTANRAGYEADLMKLSETLGALHYLRPICGGSEQGQWRAEMQTLIDAAELPADKRALLVTSFNRGFLAHEKAYRTCTPAARLAAERLLEMGTRLSREIAQRYRN